MLNIRKLPMNHPCHSRTLTFPLRDSSNRVREIVRQEFTNIKLFLYDVGKSPLTGLELNRMIRDLNRAEKSVCISYSDSSLSCQPRQVEEPYQAVLWVRGDSTTSAELFGTYPNLTELNLSYCDTVTSLQPLNGHAQLRALVLDSSTVSCEELSDLFPFPKLDSLSINWCIGTVSSLPISQALTSFSGEGIEFNSHALDLFKNHPSLEEISLDSTLIGDGDIRTLSSCLQLRLLSINGCEQVTNLQPLSTLSKLSTLNARATAIDNAAIVAVAKCPLADLDISSTAVSNLEPFNRHAYLTSLKANHTFIADSSIAALSRCPHLKQAYLDDCMEITPPLPVWAITNRAPRSPSLTPTQLLLKEARDSALDHWPWIKD